MNAISSILPERPSKASSRRHFRTIWISDIHLGTRGCNAEMLIDFLDNVDSDTLYLVGDIIDGWQLRSASTGRPRITTSSGA